MERVNNFLTYLMITQIISNHHTSKEGSGFRCLVNQTYYMRSWQEQLLIMLLLESTGLDSSLGKNLNAYVVCILSNQGDTFSTIVADSMAIGTWEETLLSHFVMLLKSNPNMFAFLSNSYSTCISRPYS